MSVASYYAPENDTEQALIEGARALAPILRQRADATAEARTLSVETVNNFAEAGFWRMLQPRRWGGLEVDPRTFFATQIEIAKGCPSTAWVLGVVAVHAWQLSIFGEQAQQEVWGNNGGAALISSSYMPVGKVTHVDGGYMLSGRWSFSSGSDHCQWIFLGAFVPPAGEGQRPDMRTFLLPRMDYEIIDNWHTSGLRGTGSKDIVVDNVFVPEHRTHRFADGFKCESPGNAVNPGPLYKLPFGQIFVRSVATTAIGIAEQALDDFCRVAAQRVSQAQGKKIKEDKDSQAIAARGSATLREVKATLFGNFATMMTLVNNGEPVPLEARVQWRYDSSRAVERCVQVVDEVFTQAGGRAIFLDHPLNRAFCDIHAARAHFANKPGPPAENLGRVMLGSFTQDFFI
jgi:3-hydroxy-9,10-secoandrosta-1,3,5(10)-triene-9,17-dione monooxygenase